MRWWGGPDLVGWGGMPVCRNCDHAGRDHNWISQACSWCGSDSHHCPFCFEKYYEGRKRGQCRYPDCACAKYVPAGGTVRPVNKFAGRMLYRKRGK